MRTAGLAALAALLFVCSARAEESASSKKKELAGIQKELEATRRSIEEYKRLEESLGKDLAKMESRNSDARKKMTQLERNLRLAEEKKTQLRGRMKALGTASGFWRSSLEDDLRAYDAALASRNESFGSVDLWAEHLRRRAILEKGALVASLKGVSTQTERAAAETSRRAVDLLKTSQKAKREQEAQRQEYEKTKAAVADAAEKKQAAIAKAKDLEESARALTRLIRTLGRGKPPYRKTGVVAKLDIPRNSLSWPAAGSIIKPFGRQRNAELDTWVVNQGILLATQPKAPVQAVDGGKVIFAGPFRSYGQVLILDHGSNFFSIYGELGELLTAKGAQVKTGETIAKAGAGKTGGNVYLELRRGTEALDPLVWLRKR